MKDGIANIIISLLSVAIFTVMILFIALPSISYYQSQQSISGNITIGQANFEFVNDLPLFSSVTDFTGGQIDESVKVINAHDKVGSDLSNLVDCYLRFQIVGSSNVSANVDTTQFTQSGAYYYYNGVFSVGNTLELIPSFYVAQATDDEYQNGINVSVQVEVMQASKDLINEVFASAPNEWINLLP